MQMSRHTNGALDYYERFWYQARGYGPEAARRRQRRLRKRAGIKSGCGSGDDPLGTQNAMIQNNMLQNLAKIAGRGIDDWMGLIDPAITYESNKQILLNNGGRKTELQRQEEAMRQARDADDLARQHASEKLQEHFDAIEAGDKEQLVADIAAEFGEEFVAGTLEAIRINQAEPDTGDFAEPVEAEPAEPTPEPAPTPTVAIDEPKGVDPAPVTAEADTADFLTEVVEFAEFLLMPSESEPTQSEPVESTGPGLFETVTDAIAGAFNASSQPKRHGSIDDNIQNIRRKRFSN